MVGKKARVHMQKAQILRFSQLFGQAFFSAQSGGLYPSLPVSLQKSLNQDSLTLFYIRHTIYPSFDALYLFFPFD